MILGKYLTHLIFLIIKELILIEDKESLVELVLIQTFLAHLALSLVGL
jgi:hypothetical protein